MELFKRCLQLSFADVCVDFGTPDRPMAKQVLNHAKIRSVIQQMRSKRMSKGMRSYAQPNAQTDRVNRFLDRRLAQWAHTQRPS